MKIHRFEFTATGRGAFPVDMLRYDQCFPSRESDSRVMADEDECGNREVRLAVHTTRRSWQPTRQRWLSFLWSASDAGDPA